ncbi:MAG: TonB-dependent siderophore receptor, partial [Cyanobacteria bacterium P01_F01_bin.153]
QTALELQTNVTGKFNTGSVNHTLLTGFDISSYDNPVNTLAALTPTVLNVFNPDYSSVVFPALNTFPFAFGGSTKYTAFGVYLQDQVEFSDQLKVLVGGRYDTVRTRSITNPSPPIFPGFPPNPGSENTENDDAFTPRLGIVYQQIEELSLYGSFSQSFFPNSGNTVTGDTLPPERGEQFEIGARTELLDGKLTANLALFNLTKQNIAVADPNFPANSGFSIARGEQRSRGIELDIIGEISPGWNILANYAHTDAELTEDDQFQGNTPFNMPEHNFNLWTTYEIQSGSLQGLSFGVGFNYVSDRFVDDANTFTVDDYFLTNASIAYKKDNWRAGLNIRNLFDVEYIEAASGGTFGGSAPGEGLTIIGSLSVEF